MARRVAFTLERRQRITDLLHEFRVRRECGCISAAPRWSAYMFRYLGTHSPACQGLTQRLLPD